jgi:hypothetical protein
MDSFNLKLSIAFVTVGIFIVFIQTRRFKNGLKDKWGHEISLLICGFVSIAAGIFMIVQTFKR